MTDTRAGRQLPAGYQLSEDPERLDLDRVHDWLSNDAYWAIGRPLERVVRAFQGSAAVGIYQDGGPQVAVARLVSDGATFAWLCDVYVDRAHRGLGLGRCLAGWAADWAARHDVPRVLLATADAHGVYATVGFRPLEDPAKWMALVRVPAPTAT